VLFPYHQSDSLKILVRGDDVIINRPAPLKESATVAGAERLFAKLKIIHKLQFSDWLAVGSGHPIGIAQ